MAVVPPGFDPFALTPAPAAPPTSATPPPESQEPPTIMDPYHAQALSEAMAPAPPPPKVAHAPHPIPAVYAREAVESGDPQQYWQQLGHLQRTPYKEKISYLRSRLETPSVDLSGMKAAPMTGAYLLGKLADQEGLRVVFQSGKRTGGGRSYHDHGEAVDVRFQRVRPDGQVVELSPAENKAAALRLGKQAGFASALDEFSYWSDGLPKQDAWNNAPHIHLAWGNEKGLAGHPMHTQLTSRHWTDSNYLADVDKPYLSKDFKPAQEESKDGVRARLPGLVETMAHVYGINPNVAVNWISAESGFNSGAVSPAGARGLAQMMPETIKEVAAQLKVDPSEYDKSEKMQIKFGMHYLKQQLDKHNGNYARALASYNMGPGAVDAYLSGKGGLASETREYVYKILGDHEPWKTSHDAEISIRDGKGFTMSPEAGKQFVHDTLYNAKGQVHTLLGEVLGQVGGEGAAITGDALQHNSPIGLLEYAAGVKSQTEDPLSYGSRMHALLNEALHDLSFGIVPLTEHTKEVEQAGLADIERLKGSSDWLERGLGTIGSPATTLGFGGLRALSMNLTGGILARGARMLPFVGKMIASKEAAAAGEPIYAGLFKNLNGTAAGKMLPDLIEGTAAGALGMGMMQAADYAWEYQGDRGTLDFAQGLVANAMSGTAMGSLLGLGFGLGVPLVIGGGATVLNSALGLGSRSLAEGGIAKFGAEIGQLNPGSRAIAMGGMGGIAGFTGGALAQQAGLTDNPDAPFEMAQAGAALGAGTGLGWNQASKLIDKVALSKLMQSPKVQQSLAPIKEWVAKQNEQWIRAMSSEVAEGMAANNKRQLSNDLKANTLLDLNSTKQTLGKVEELVTGRKQTLLQMQAEQQKLEAGMQSLGQMEEVLAQKYPNASALRSQMDQKTMQMQMLGKAGAGNPASQPQIAQLQMELKQLQMQVLKDKDLGKEVVAFNNEKQILGQRKQVMAQQHQGLLESIKDTQSDISAFEDIRQIHAHKQSTLEGLLAKSSISSEDVSGLRYGVKLNSPFTEYSEHYADSPWNKLTDKAALQAEHESQLSDMLTRQSLDIIRHGKMLPKGAADLQINQFLRGASPKTPEEFQGALSQRIEQLRESIDKAENGKGFGQFAAHRNAKAAQAWAKRERSLVQWDTDLPKDHVMVTADAQAIRRAALDAMESGGGKVALDTLFQQSRERAKGLYLAEGVKPLVYNSSKLESLAAEAEAAMHLQERVVPIMVPKAQLAEYKKLAEAGLESLKGEAKREAAAMLVELERAHAAHSLPEYKVSAMPGAEDLGSAAEGGVLDEVFRPETAVQSIKSRVQKLEAGLRNIFKTDSELTQFNDFLTGGDIKLAPREVRDWVRKGDESAIPEQVKKWREAVTLTQVEEVRRLRQLEGLMQGRDATTGDPILTQARVRMAALFSPKEYSANSQPFLSHMQQIVSRDTVEAREVGREFASMMRSDEPAVHDQVFSRTQSHYRDQHYNRMNLKTYMMDEMVKPYMAEQDMKLQSHWKTQGISDVVAYKEKFYKDMSEGLENPAKLQTFLKNHPEAQDVVDTFFGMQDIMQAVHRSSPELEKWTQASYVLNRYRRFRAHYAAAEEGERLSMAEAVERGHLRKYRTNAEVEAAVKGVETRVQEAGFENGDDFLQSSREERAKRLHLQRKADIDQAWENMTEKERIAARKVSDDATVTLLLQDPITHPADLIDIQLSSLFHADSQRNFLRGLIQMPVNVGTEEAPRILRALEPSKVPTAYFDNNGKAQRNYLKLSDIPGFHSVEMEINGERYKAHEMMLHPEAHRFLSEYASGGNYSPGYWTRQLQRLQSLGRNVTLMGTFIPHLVWNMLSSHVVEFIRQPWKASKMMVAGSALGETALEQKAFMANAIRSGVNIRSLEKQGSFIAKSVLDEFGFDVSSRLYGLEEGRLGRFLQSIDPSDPLRFEAKKQLSTPTRVASDILGILPHVDYVVNREMLFRNIEAGQLAGFHARAQRYLAENAQDLEVLAPDDRLRAAMQVAADQVNRAAGAYPHIYQSNALRQGVNSLLLTPSWFLSKAYTMVDAMDGALHLAMKGAGKVTGRDLGETPLRRALNRRPFDYLPEAMRDATRHRMAKMVFGAMAGSFAMTQAMQYAYDGSMIWDHPPDKLLHIRMNNEYVTGPMVGMVKDLMRFIPDAASANGREWGPSMQSVLEATQNAVIRQLNPSVLAAASFMKKFHQGEILNAPDAMMEFANSMAQEGAKAQLETLGINSREFNARNLHGYLQPGGNEDARASAIKARNYLFRQAGLYDSPDREEMEIRGEFYDRKRDVERRARQAIAPLIQKARRADSASEEARWIRMAYDRYFQGVPVRDAQLRELYPDGTFRMSEKEFENMLLEVYAPEAKAMMGVQNQPVGILVQQALQQSNEE